MRSNTGLLILFFLLFVGLVIRYTMFEKRVVGDLNWDSKLEYLSTDPLGLSVFYNSLEDNYDVKILDSIPYDKNNSLYIAAINDDYRSKRFISRLAEKAKDGAEVLILSKSIGEIDSLFTYDDTFYPKDSVWYDTGNDRTYIPKKTGAFYVNLRDLIISPDTNTIVLDTVSFTSMDSTGLEIPIKTMVCFKLGEGKIGFSACPFLVTNYHSNKPFYRNYINDMLSSFENQKIRFIRAPKAKLASKSPIKHILKRRSLGVAYYLLILTSLLFVVFGGKREQRTIPIVTSKRNTIMEFVDTINLLYQRKGSINDVALLMVENFYHFVEKKYFLLKTDENFWEKLGQKSKYDETSLGTLKASLDEKYIDKIKSYKDFAHFYRNIEKFKKAST